MIRQLSAVEFWLFLPAFVAKRPEERKKFLMITPNTCKIYFYLPALAVLLLLSKSPTNAFGNAPEKIETDMKVLFEFTGAEPSPEWSATNDTVMGGVSKGKAELTKVGMDFSGHLSLENNGGFASVHTGVDLDLSDYSGIRLKVLGDGRIYQLRFELSLIHI